jgi:hypothetical protein
MLRAVVMVFVGWKMNELGKFYIYARQSIKAMDVPWAELAEV